MVLTGLFVIAGVVLGRVDLVLLAMPFALGTAWALRRRPDLPARLEISVGGGFTVEGGDVAGVVSVGNPGVAHYDAVVLRAAASPWLALADGDRPHVVAVPPRRAADLVLAGTARRWGRHPLGPAEATVFACAGLLWTAPEPASAATVRVYPVADPFDADEAMPRAAGLVGGHRSRRPGEGGELSGVRRFAPGDRLRRVDWRVTLRTGELHVASTLSDRDAEVVLLLDLLSDVGRSGGAGGPASVLDTTVRAAAAVAAHYLHRGDRVSLLEYGPGARRLPPGSGRRQLLRVLEWLLEVRVGGHGVEGVPESGPHGLPTQALIVVMTPLADARSEPMLARLARSGRYVVAVDTLPPKLPVPQIGSYSQVAYRLWRLEREQTIDALREHGVPVVPWAGAGSLDQVLRDISRLAAGPRAGVRG